MITQSNERSGSCCRSARCLRHVPRADHAQRNVRHWAGNIAMETRTLATRFTIKTTWDTMAAANGGLPAICPKRMRIDQMHAQGGRRFNASRGRFCSAEPPLTRNKPVQPKILARRSNTIQLADLRSIVLLSIGRSMGFASSKIGSDAWRQRNG